MDRGEGDRSLAYWREAHVGFFTATGTPPEDDTEVVLERFDLLWAPPAGGWLRHRFATIRDHPVSACAGSLATCPG